MQYYGGAFKGLDTAFLQGIHGEQQRFDVVIERFVAEGCTALVI